MSNFYLFSLRHIDNNEIFVFKMWFYYILNPAKLLELCVHLVLNVHINRMWVQYICICIYVCIYICTYVCMYVCMYVYIYVCVCVCCIIFTKTHIRLLH